MATLCLGNIECSAPLLRDWLSGGWGLLFSHPADFQDQGMEHDRWLQILRAEFQARSVQPLACRRTAGDADAGWVGELIRDQRLIRLQGADSVNEDVIDLAARNLRDEILTLTSHFALIVDESLQRRGVLKYSAGRTSVSPLDLLASIDAMRRRFGRSTSVRSRAAARAVA
jgi:alkyl hydroperoxide reductase subunit AhpC